jgi:DNA-binding transcriptional MocR family regulator
MQIAHAMTGTVDGIKICYPWQVATPGKDAPLYIRIAESLARQMARGVLRPGDRVQSLRELSGRQRVSMSTAQQAYLWLETRGYLEARPQSGYYVRTPFSELIPEPEFETRKKAQARAAGSHGILADFLTSANDPAAVPFGAGCASPELFPCGKMNLILRRIVNRNPFHGTRYEFPPGWEALRRQIARRALDMGCAFSVRDLIVTGGALEAVGLSLRAVARPGDTVAVESPTYFGILGNIAAMGMKVVEIPTHPQRGMDLDQLARAIRQHRVKACIAMANCHNPLGYVLPDDYKRALVELAARSQVALIEDDIYGDLAFDGPRPRTAKSFDRKGTVLLCSSFSKVLPPGYRVGWVAPGRFRAEVERLKLVTTVAAPTLPQMVIAEFLESGGYDRHLKRLRTTLRGQVEVVRQAIAKYFPAGTRISRPAGGYMLWIELPRNIDAIKLYRAALAEHITILPGTVFSASGRYRNYIRINCGHAWSEIHDRALLTLGRLCDSLVRS